MLKNLISITQDESVLIGICVNTVDTKVSEQ